jgi:glutamate/aspartate transport system permease protein
MDWAVIPPNIPYLLGGLWISVQLAAVTIAFSFPLGCLIAVGRLSSNRWISGFCGAFVNVLRSNPLILILFWFYFLVPLLIGRAVGDLTSTIIAFVIFFAAYFTEIVRSGIQSVGLNQIQAGLSSGLTYLQTMRYIVLPQAIRAMLPALTTECIIIFQATTVAYVIGVSELLHRTSLVAERTIRPAELYVFVAVVYLVICYSASLFARSLEKSR